LTLYEQVAERVAGLIRRGTFRPGDRIPSVRRLSQELRVSVTTVLEAYHLLEDRGLIESRPQSGHFVRVRLPEVREIQESRPSVRPTQIGVQALVMQILQDSQDPSLVQLGAAIPNPELLPTERLSRGLAAAARRLGAAGYRYEMPPGSEALRVQISRRALAAQCILAPEDLVITNGCLEALTLCLRTLCQPGDTVAIESPTYFGVLQGLQLLGLRALEIPTHPRTGLSLDALRFALDSAPVKACVVMSNFNNPLGSMMPDDSKRKLVELLAQREIPLIEDDIYGDLAFASSRPTVCKAYDRQGLVLLCSSFSKDLAPGFRVGWVAPGRWREQVLHLKAATNLATATLPQVTIADFLASADYERHLTRLRRTYARQVAQVTQAVLKFFPEGTRVSRPQGGFVLWVELPDRVDSLELYERALQHRITFAPGPIFSARQRFRNFLRLNCAYWSEEVERALATLGRLAAS
jgi:DNA-binding transcriptional MocR family regulator